ncbi:Protein ULTRAPETALA 1-like protein [Melia azedarach]|uniref:Protein ULTRAPETALA 1-like protein n=1 Tax=Melia azedarach TaxID=155640 RepID=A0ACC1YSW9_MELAZ|nr:Protein ULTRAPETALA 1-like protein [Melia azedarach]
MLYIVDKGNAYFKAASTMFGKAEIEDMQVLKRGYNYIEVRCGCTSRKYGDAIGKLKIFASGKFLIDCECSPDCPEKKMTPYDFEKHSGKEGNRRWTHHIWVLMNEEKVPLYKTALLNYYKHATNEASNSSRGKRTFHRDEFIRCARCKKQRRFRLRTKEECRIYHDALGARRWKCHDRPYDKITCDDDEERPSRINCKGCPRFPTCEGCAACVCVGCFKCRFKDCKCRICVDFVKFADP